MSAKRRGGGPADRFAQRVLRRRVRTGAGAALAVVLLAAFSLYTVVGQSVDTLVMYAFAAHLPFLKVLDFLLHTLVSTPALLFVTAVMAVAIVIRRRFALFWRVAAVLVLANGTTQLLKMALIRPNLGVGHPLANSYPSGHVTLVASIMLVLVAAVPPRYRTATAIFGWALTTVVGMTVMGLGWHRLSDVLGAVLVAFAFAVAILPSEWDARGRHRSASAGAWAWAGAVVGGALLPFVLWGSRAVLVSPTAAITLQMAAGPASVGWGLIASGTLLTGAVAGLGFVGVAHLRGR